MKWVREWFKPNTRRALLGWYLLTAGSAVYGLVVCALLRRQPIHVFWFIFRGMDEIVYLAMELGVLFLLCLGLWKRMPGTLSVGISYELYMLIEQGSSLRIPSLWAWGYQQAISTPTLLERITHSSLPTPHSILAFATIFLFMRHVIPLTLWLTDRKKVLA